MANTEAEDFPFAVLRDNAGLWSMELAGTGKRQIPAREIGCNQANPESAAYRPHNSIASRIVAAYAAYP